MSKQNQPKLEEYPVDQNDKFQILGAVTIYRFMNRENTEGRWQAALHIRSVYNDRGEEKIYESVRVFTWKYREKYRKDGDSFVGTGEYKWFQIQEMSISQKKWEDTKNAIEKLLKELPDPS